MKSLLKKNFLFLLAMALLSLLSALATAQTAQETINTKHAVLKFDYAENSFSLNYARISYGNPPKALVELDSGLKIKVLDSNEGVTNSFFIEDPRTIHLEAFLKNGSIESETMTVNETSFLVVIPFSGKERAVALYEKNTELVTASLDEAIFFFCNNRNGVCDADCEYDADCETETASPTPSPQNAAGSTPSPSAASPAPAVLKENALKETRTQAQKIDFASFALALFMALLLLVAVYGLFFKKRRTG